MIKRLALVLCLAATPALAWLHANPTPDAIVDDAILYQVGSFTVDQVRGPFAAGITSSQRIDFNRSVPLSGATFPGPVNFSWAYAANAVVNIKTFNDIQFGDYNSTTPPLPITPSKVSAIGTLTTTIDASINGAVSGADAITDLFLTDMAWNTTAAHHQFEIEIAHHTPPFFKTYADSVTTIGTFTDARGVAWKASIDTTANGGVTPDILFYPVGLQDELVGTYDLKAMLQWLVTQGRLTGNEYYNGHGFGSEVQQGTGNLSVRKYAVNYVPATTNLLGVSNLADPTWQKSAVTVTGGGTSAQTLLETATTAVHSLRLDMRKPAVATNYRLEYDITQSATSGLSRDYFLAQAANQGFSAAIYHGVKTSGTPSIFQSYGYGGYTLNGTSSIGTPSAGVSHVIIDFQTDAQQYMSFVLNPEAVQGTDSYAGSTSSGAAVTNVTLSAR